MAGGRDCRARLCLATIYAGDIEPDYIGGIGYGIRPLVFTGTQTLPAANDWGAIGAGAWGMSRVIDVLTKDPAVDTKAFIAFGFSRFGKTALWAAAQDKRFGIVISKRVRASGRYSIASQTRRTNRSLDAGVPILVLRKLPTLSWTRSRPPGRRASPARAHRSQTSTLAARSLILFRSPKENFWRQRPSLRICSLWPDRHNEYGVAMNTPSEPNLMVFSG
jgi:hypothetical protein